MLDALTKCGVTGRAVDSGLIEVNGWNPRDYATNQYRRVDDRPYGGGPGMILKVDIILRAVKDILRKNRKIKDSERKIILLSAKGKKFNQKMAKHHSRD